jgi:Restriction endonuclease
VAIETMCLGGIAHNFWGLIGSVVAAVLPTTRDIFEPTVRPYGAIRRNCQGVNAVSWQNFVPRAGVWDKGADGGVDIIAHKDELGFEPPIIKVQVKSKEGTSSDPEVSALYGKCDKNEYALFVTIGDFTNQADNFARNKPNLRLIAGSDLAT